GRAAASRQAWAMAAMLYNPRRMDCRSRTSPDVKSLWSDAEAEALVAHYAARGVGREIALCLFGSRLFGGDKRLVLHGGGNTSVKTVLPDLFREPAELLCIKGSGRDLAALDPE